MSNAPDIPALNEKGLEFVRFGWLGICAETGTPQPIIAELNRHIVSDRRHARIPGQDHREGGSIPASSTPAELGRSSTQTLDDVASTIREFGMQQD